MDEIRTNLTNANKMTRKFNKYTSSGGANMQNKINSSLVNSSGNDHSQNLISTIGGIGRIDGLGHRRGRETMAGATTASQTTLNNQMSSQNNSDTMKMKNEVLMQNMSINTATGALRNPSRMIDSQNSIDLSPSF